MRKTILILLFAAGTAGAQVLNGLLPGNVYLQGPTNMGSLLMPDIVAAGWLTGVTVNGSAAAVSGGVASITLSTPKVPIFRGVLTNLTWNLPSGAHTKIPYIAYVDTSNSWSQAGLVYTFPDVYGYYEFGQQVEFTTQQLTYSIIIVGWLIKPDGSTNVWGHGSAPVYVGASSASSCQYSGAMYNHTGGTTRLYFTAYSCATNVLSGIGSTNPAGRQDTSVYVKYIGGN